VGLSPLQTKAVAWEQLGNNYARTPGELREQGRPVGKTNQQLREPSPVCKTSIPGSNPGGASKNVRVHSGEMGETRIQPIDATISASLSAGVRYCRVIRGRAFNRNAIASSCAWLYAEKSAALGRY
jgi:hypothetical protein